VAETSRLTGRQIAAGRTLIGMSQSDLARMSRVSVQTLRRMEGSEGPSSGYVNNVASVRAALEAAGVIFVEENGGGHGVRLQKNYVTAPATDGWHESGQKDEPENK
jgi:transcriptional regulator with XRE-family HTH domain